MVQQLAGDPDHRIDEVPTGGFVFLCLVGQKSPQQASGLFFDYDANDPVETGKHSSYLDPNVENIGMWGSRASQQV